MKKNKITFLLVVCLVSLVLVSCSCGKRYYKTYSEMEPKLNEVYVKGNDEASVAARKEKLQSVVTYEAKNTYVDFVSAYIKTTNTNVDDDILAIRDNLATTIGNISIDTMNENEYTVKVSEALFNSLNEAIDAAGVAYINTGVNNNLTVTGDDFITSKTDGLKNVTLLTYLVREACVQVNESVDLEEYDDYQQLLFEDLQKTTVDTLLSVDVTIENEELGELTYDQVLNTRANEVYKIVENFASSVVKTSTQPEPIRFELNSFGDFFSNFFDNFLIYPVGLLLMFFSKLFGGKYIFGLLITTIIIRTLGWPIYTKTNDMSLKMKLMEPEQAKIQEKYARRKDEESQRMMQMEMMQLYKKYKVGLGGCLMPFLQFPIFMAVFRAISRIPYTNGFAGSNNWVGDIDSYIFGIDLFADKTASKIQLIGIIVLVVLVVGTQILQQVISNKKQKEQQEKAQEDIPAYRRKAVQQTKGGMAGQMKVMMWTMTGMMGVFVYSSAAGLGVYWLIGNLYAIAQQFINSKNSEKRMEKLKNKHSR